MHCCSELQRLRLLATSCASALPQMTLINLELCSAFSRHFTVNTVYSIFFFLKTLLYLTHEGNMQAHDVYFLGEIIKHLRLYFFYMDENLLEQTWQSPLHDLGLSYYMNINSQIFICLNAKTPCRLNTRQREGWNEQSFV